MDVILISIGLLLALTLILSLQSAKRKKLPPGPTPIPIIGNLHLLGNLPHKSIAELAKTYGPIMCLQLGQITTVVISSAAMAKEVLQKQDSIYSVNRSIPDTICSVDHHKYSVIFLPASTRWRNLRKIINSCLLSSKHIDLQNEMRNQKVKDLIAFCRRKSENGEGVDISLAIFRTIMNMLSNSLFSTDVADLSSDSATVFEHVLREGVELFGKPNLSDFFLFLKTVDLQGLRRRVTVLLKKFIDLHSDQISRRLEQQIAKNDVLDALLTISRENTDEMDKNQIEYLFSDIFVAGTDTTSRTIEWAMAETLKHPKIMKRAIEELDKVVGKGEIVTESVISSLNYLQSIVKETLRLHPSAPFLIPRKVDRHVDLCGYEIPKNSQVLVNVWAIGRDEEVWENPLEFKPERFMDCEVSARGNHFELIPFGAGRRLCPGLALGERMVTVMVGSLLNSFDWKLEGGIEFENLDMGETFGIIVHKTYPLQVIPIPV